MKRTPLRKKRPTKRAYKTPRCVGGWPPARASRCKQPQKKIERCPKHADEYLDGLWGLAIRTDRCEVEHPFPCGGVLQACHGFDRIDKGTRWDVRNGFSGCAASNAYFHVHKRRWYSQIRRVWGEERFAELEALANGTTHPDHDAIRAALLAALAVRGLDAQARPIAA